MVAQIDSHKALLSSGYHCDQPVTLTEIIASTYVVLSAHQSLADAAIKTREESANMFPVVLAGSAAEDNVAGRLVGIINRVDLLTHLNAQLALCKNA